MNKPSIGRIVHYVTRAIPGHWSGAPEGVHQAAIITQVLAGAVSLQVFSSNGLFFASTVVEDPSGEKPGSWHWPERVE